MAEAMMEPYLKKEIDASQAEVAIVFFIVGGSFSICTPLAGYVRYKLKYNILILNIRGM